MSAAKDKPAKDGKKDPTVGKFPPRGRKAGKDDPGEQAKGLLDKILGRDKK